MKKMIAGFALAALALTTLPAGADPYADRSAIMKAIGKAAFGGLGPVVKGEKPFDAAEVNAALAEINTQAMKVDVAALFPEGSNTGESTAAPKIWEDLAGFTAGMDKFKADAAAAVAANPQDLEALKVQFGAVTKNCGACHETYRIKKG
jgi:cytochrome c556